MRCTTRRLVYKVSQPASPRPRLRGNNVSIADISCVSWRLFFVGIMRRRPLKVVGVIEPLVLDFVLARINGCLVLFHGLGAAAETLINGCIERPPQCLACAMNPCRRRLQPVQRCRHSMPTVSRL